MIYLWLRALHVLGFVSWMAGLLYLPRLFVYHTTVAKGSEASETFKKMERRLLRYIMLPAMLITWGSGLTMIYMEPSWLQDGWMHVKLAGVVLMTVLHHMFGIWRKAFANDRNTHSEKFYRILNEVPTILMIIIVIMAVVKPF